MVEFALNDAEFLEASTALCIEIRRERAHFYQRFKHARVELSNKFN